METRFLGKSGLKISVLSFGTMTFGGSDFFQEIGATQVDEAQHLIDICLDAGVNISLWKFCTKCLITVVSVLLKSHSTGCYGLYCKNLQKTKALYKSEEVMRLLQKFEQQILLEQQCLFFNSLDLSLTDHIHSLISAQGSPRRVERGKSHSWFDQSFNKPMVLLNIII